MPTIVPETLTAFEALLDGYFRRLELQAEGILAANRPGELDRALAELEQPSWHRPLGPRLVWSR